jgi:filamentous hemagglutinin family protein
LIEVVIASIADCVLAQSQIIPDNTLPEKSIVTPNYQDLTVEVISGGTQQGTNLFHSFREFNVSEGRGAYFYSPNNAIANILARVTGTNPSEILGKLGTFGNSQPNLFLMNPNGIIFGQNASLDVQGAFVATTANAIQFGNQGFFSATNPQSPTLLTVNPSAFFFNQIQAAQIKNQSSLQVPNGQSLLLVGGDINLEGGKLFAPGGRVELASVGEAGTVGLNINNNLLNLAVPESIAGANISLTKGAEINVRAGGGGDITINAQNLTVDGASNIRAGIAEGLGSANAQAGNIEIKAKENITLSNGSSISNLIVDKAKGNGGNINIATNNLSLSNNAFLNTGTAGEGDAGNINIKATESVYLDSSTIASGIVRKGIGNGGNIDIETDLLTLDNVAILYVFGAGGGSILVNARNVDILGGSIIRGGIVQGTIDTQAGNIEINATEKIKLEGNSTNPTAIIEGAFANGNAGDVVINTKILEGSGNFLIDSVLLAGQGNAGNITITATEKISLLGDSITDEDGITTSLGLISTSVLGSGKGNAGNISITTPSLLLVNSSINSNIAEEAAGNGGNIQINATNSLSATGSSLISASNSGLGNGGNIVINAPTGTVTFDGAKIGTTVFQPTNLGQGGDIVVRARNFSLSNNAQLNSFTFGKGNAGDIEIQATDSVSVSSQSLLNASTLGAGNAGNISIEAPNGTVSFDGLFTLASTSVVLEPTTNLGATGQGGDIFIKARSLSLTNGAILSTHTIGREGANGGNIEVNVSDSVSVSGGAGFSSATAGQGNAGKVTITAGGAVSFDGTLVVDKNNPILNNPNAPIPFNFFAEGTLVNNKFLLLFSGIENLVASSTNLQGIGRGGDINITAQSLSLTNGALINASTNGKGDAGNINIDVRDGVTLSGFTTVNLDGVDVGSFNTIGTAVAEAGVGLGGNITIKARSLTMNDFSAIIASTSGQGKAGNIDLQVDDSVTLANASVIRSAVEQGGVGDGGNIDLSGRSLTLIDGGEIIATVNEQAFNLPAARGNGGNIRINTTDFVNISGFNSIRFPNRNLNNLEEIPTEGFISGLFVNTETGTSGSAGTITVTTGDFRIADGAIVKASTANDFNAGSITINAKTFEATRGGQIISSTDSGGTAGNINLNISDSFTLSDRDPTYTDRLARFGVDIVGDQGGGSGVFADTSPQSTGQGGNITINTGEFTIRDGAQVTASSQGTGDAGNINQIGARNLTLDNGSITTTSPSGNGGNIENLQVQNVLLLRNGSQISTTAGTQQSGGGDGGNINLKAGFIIAIPNENNKITANAFQGSGGTINITTNGIFGLAPNRDITASSSFGIDGTVALTILEVDPVSGLARLPSTTVDRASLIAQDVCAIRENQIAGGSSFVIKGKGGLPNNPNEPLSNLTGIVEWANPVEDGENIEVEVQGLRPEQDSSRTIQEAQGWIQNPDGTIALVASSPTVTPQSPNFQLPECSRVSLTE